MPRSRRPRRSSLDTKDKSINSRRAARWRSGDAADCKSVHGGSIPPRASTDMSLGEDPAGAQAIASCARRFIMRRPRQASRASGRSAEGVSDARETKPRALRWPAIIISRKAEPMPHTPPVPAGNASPFPLHEPAHDKAAANDKLALAKRANARMRKRAAAHRMPLVLAAAAGIGATALAATAYFVFAGSADDQRRSTTRKRKGD